MFQRSLCSRGGAARLRAGNVPTVRARVVNPLRRSDYPEQGRAFPARQALLRAMSCGKQRRGRASTARDDGYSRRTFLRVVGGALGGAWLTLDLSKVAQAAHAAQRAQESPGAADARRS